MTWVRGKGLPPLAPCQWQSGELALMPSERENWPCLSPAAALGREVPPPRLDSRVELAGGCELCESWLWDHKIGELAASSLF